MNIFVLMNRRTQIIFWLKEILQKNLADISYRAFIFGSQANLQELRRADIDVGLIGNKEIQPQHLSKINEAIENLPMLYNVDIVDFSNVDEQFKTVAFRNIEWL